jgi:hypothetical protein
MALISSVSSAAQYGMQLRVQQAEQTAQSLAIQARDAQRKARQAQENADTLASQSDKAEIEARQLGRENVAASGQQQAATQLGKLADRVAASRQVPTSRILQSRPKQDEGNNLFHRQRKAEFCAAPAIVRGPEASAMGGDELLATRQPQSETMRLRRHRQDAFHLREEVA